MKITREMLSESLKTILDMLVKDANLPERMRWGTHVQVRDMSIGAGAMGRFIDGIFEVSVGENTWVFDGNISETSCYIGWNVEIETETGSVTAVPVIKTHYKSGPKPLDPVLFGFEPRTIGSLGPLRRFIPSSDDDDLRDQIDLVIKNYGFSFVYGTLEEVRRGRAILYKCLSGFIHST